MNTDTQPENTDELQTFIDKLGIEYNADFIPARQTDRPDQINWQVALRVNKNWVRVHYSQGVGHLPGYKQTIGRQCIADSVRQKDIISEGIQHGNALKFSRNGFPSRKKLEKPSIKDILYSLVSDADALQYIFEDWVGMFGYDTDSMKAKAVYDACIAEGISLRNMIGQGNINKLNELFQDY